MYKLWQNRPYREPYSIGMIIPVSCDFEADLRKVLLARLDGLGFCLGEGVSTDEILVSFLNVSLLQISPGPRNVRWSKALMSRRLTLPQHLLRPIEQIEMASIRGEDLNPYLTRSLTKKKNAAFKDFQFNDWGMKHLHLGETKESPGVIKGTDELLFIIERPTTLYFIEVGSHQDWADQRLFEIVAREWPELFEGWRLRGVIGMEHENPTPDERKRLRSGNVTTPTQSNDGTVFAPPGGGQLANGCNLRVRLQADSILDRLNSLEEAYKGNGEMIAALLFEKSGQAISEVHLVLVDLNNSEPVILEAQTGIQFI